MRTLFLDLASNQGSLAVVGSDKTLAFKAADHRISDADLLPQVEQLLSEAGLTFKDLTRIACVVGPGGFTSLRVAVAFANVLADQLAIPSVGIHLSDLYAARTSEESWVWTHSTKSTHLFVRGFGSFKDQWPEPTLVAIEELAGQLPEGALWTGELIPLHREALSGKNLAEMQLQSLEETLPDFLTQLPFEETLLTPWYGRGW